MSVTISEWAALGPWTQTYEIVDSITNILADPTFNGVSAVSLHNSLATLRLAGRATVTAQVDEAHTLANLTAAQITTLAAASVRTLDPLNDDHLALATAKALGTAGIVLSETSYITVDTTGSAIAAMTTGDIAALVVAGVDDIDASDNAIALTVAKASAFIAANLMFDPSDIVTLVDTGAAIATLNQDQIGSLINIGIFAADASNNTIFLSIAQATAFADAAVTFAANDVITINDSGATIEALDGAGLEMLGGINVKILNATDNVLHVSLEQLSAIQSFGIDLTAADTITLADTAEAIMALTPADPAALKIAGIDKIDVLDDVITLPLDLAQAFANAGLAFVAGDQITVAGESTLIAALTATQLTALKTAGVDAFDLTDDFMTLTAAKALAFVTAGIGFSEGDNLVIADTGAAIGALTTIQIGQLADFGVTMVDASNDVLALSLVKANAFIAAGIFFDGSDTVSVIDTAAVLVALNPDQIAALTGVGISTLDASGNAVALTIDQALALEDAGMHYADNDVVTVSAGSDAIEALNDSEIQMLGSAGVKVLNATNDVLHLGLDQIFNIQASGITLTAADTVILVDIADAIMSLDPTALAELKAFGIDKVDVSDDAIMLSIEQAQAYITAGLSFSAGDQITIVDDSTLVGNLTASQFTALKTLGADAIDLVDDFMALTVAKAQIFATAGLPFDETDMLVIADTGAAIAALTPAQITAFATMGVETVDASNDVLNLTAARALAFATAGIFFDGSDIVTIVDTGAAIAALTPDQLALLSEAGIMTLDASNNALTLTVAGLQAFVDAPMGFAENDVVTLVDTGEAIACLSDGDFFMLAEMGVKVINASDNVLNLDATQLDAIVQTGIALTAADTIRLSDVADALHGRDPLYLADLKALGVDGIDVADDFLELSVEEAQAFVTARMVFNPANEVIVADDSAVVAALTPAQLTALKAIGIDGFNLFDDAISLTVAQATAFGTAGLSFDESDVAYIADTGAAIAALTPAQIAGLVAAGITTLDATNDAVTLTVARANAFATGCITFDASDHLTIVDTGAAIAALTVDQIGALVEAGFVAFDASNNAVSLTVAKALAFAEAGVGFAAGDVITIADTGAAIGNLSGFDIAALGELGVHGLDAANNVVALDLVQLEAIEAASITLAVADTVRLAEASDAILELLPSDLAHLKTLGVDGIDLTDDAISLTVAQAQAFTTAGLAFAPGDEVTVVTSGSAVAALTSAQIAAFKALGVDTFDLSDDAITLTVTQAAALATAGIGFADGDVPSLFDAGINIAKFTAAQFTALGASGITTINCSNDAVALTVAQARACAAAGIAFAAGDVVKLVDTGAAIAALTAGQIAGLAAVGVDGVHASNNAVSLSLEKAQAFVTAGISFATADLVTVLDTGAALAALDAGDMATLKAIGVDSIDSSTNLLTLSLAQANAFATAGLTLTAADTVLLSDTGANVAVLTAGDVTALTTAGFDGFDLSDNALTLTIARATAFGTAGMHFAADDVLKVQETGAVLTALTATQITALKAAGVDVLDASDNTLTLNVARAQAFLTAGLHFASGDAVTLVDTGANIAKITPVQLAGLAAAGVDVLDASSNAISLGAAQYNALGSLIFAANDKLTVVGVSGVDTLTALGAQVTLQGLGGNDVLTGGATVDILAGGLGNDHLIGGAGADTFLFDSKAGATNIDIISSFTIADDTFVFDHKVFSGLTVAASLDVNAFHIGTAAADASDRIIYDDNTGALYFDVDGTGGKPAVKIATLDAHLTLTHDDFAVL